MLCERVQSTAEGAASAYYRLVLVVGPPATGKTTALMDLSSNRGWPYMNVNLELTSRLLDLTRTQRVLQTPRILEDLVAERARDVGLLDNVEILFSPALQHDPLRLLQALSRHRTIIASWPGRIAGRRLTYADVGHPEHRQYEQPEALLVLTEPEPEGGVQ